MVGGVHGSTSGEEGWASLAPSRHPFEVRHLEGELCELLRGFTRRPESFEGEEWRSWCAKLLGRISGHLRGRYGDWARGWGAGQDSEGVVRSWCCPRHSFFKDDQRELDPIQGAKVITTALQEWRRHLEVVEATFRQIAPPEGTPIEEAALEAAAARIVTLVVDATGCHDMWYSYVGDVFDWYLDFIGAPEGDRTRIGAIFTNGFESWTVPDDPTKERVVKDVAREARAALGL